MKNTLSQTNLYSYNMSIIWSVTPRIFAPLVTRHIDLQFVLTYQIWKAINHNQDQAITTNFCKATLTKADIGGVAVLNLLSITMT